MVLPHQLLRQHPGRRRSALSSVSTVGMEEEVESRSSGFSDKAICPDYVDDVVLRRLIEANLCENVPAAEHTSQVH